MPLRVVWLQLCLLVGFVVEWRIWRRRGGRLRRYAPT
jgi:hypothetical protein